MRYRYIWTHEVPNGRGGMIKQIKDVMEYEAPDGKKLSTHKAVRKAVAAFNHPTDFFVGTKMEVEEVREEM